MGVSIREIWRDAEDNRINTDRFLEFSMIFPIAGTVDRKFSCLITLYHASLLFWERIDKLTRGHPLLSKTPFRDISSTNQRSGNDPNGLDSPIKNYRPIRSTGSARLTCGWLALIGWIVAETANRQAGSPFWEGCILLIPALKKMDGRHRMGREDTSSEELRSKRCSVG